MGTPQGLSDWLIDNTIISPLFTVIYMTTSDINGTECAMGDPFAHTRTQSAPNLTNANTTKCRHIYRQT